MPTHPGWTPARTGARHVSPFGPRVGEEQVHRGQPGRLNTFGQQFHRVADLDPHVRHPGGLRRREQAGDAGHMDVDGEHVVGRVPCRIRDGRGPVPTSDVEDNRRLAPEGLHPNEWSRWKPREGRYRSSRSRVSADRRPCRPAYERIRSCSRSGLIPAGGLDDMPLAWRSRPLGVHPRSEGVGT